MRVVIDTNVILSAVLGGTLKAILDHWQNERFILVVTDEIVREYLDVLQRPKFGLRGDVIDNIATFVFQFAEFVVPIEHVQVVKADPKDDKFLDAVMVGKVDVLVSGDKHLLDLKEYVGVPIITPREFLKRL
jgi:putative PIN family toxin of toxin-antitoxin system